MIAVLVLDGVLFRIREDHAPGASGVCTAPQRLVAGIDHLGVPRIERERVDYPAQVEHAPGPGAIQCDVGAGHVAVLQHDVGIVGTDGGCDHGAAPAGADNRPGVAARSGSGLARPESDSHHCQSRKGSSIHKTCWNCLVLSTKVKANTISFVVAFLRRPDYCNSASAARTLGITAAYCRGEALARNCSKQARARTRSPAIWYSRPRFNCASTRSGSSSTAFSK